MRKISMEELSVGSRYPADVLDEYGAVLVPASTEITESLINWLRSRNVPVFMDEEKKIKSPESAISEADIVLQESRKIDRVSFLDAPSFDKLFVDLSFIQSPRIRPTTFWRQNNPRVRALDARLGYYPNMDKPTGQRLNDSCCNVPEFRSLSYKHKFLLDYSEALEKVKDILDKTAQGVLSDAGPLKDLIERLIEYFLKDTNLLFNLSMIKSTQEENLYHHSLNVCNISILLASAMNYNYQQVVEIGIGALLHDIGMMFVSPQIRYKSSPLSPQEKTIIKSHPVDGLFLASKIKGLPESTAYIIYQHHEREDGSGYPFGRQKQQTHRFARIVGLADMFEAMTDTRSYRKAHHPYDAMVELLRLVGRRKMSGDLMQQFLRYISIFPVGSYVRLNDGRLAKVIQSSGKEMLSPVVAIVHPEQIRAGKESEKINLSTMPEFNVTNVIPAAEIPYAKLLEGF